MMIVAPQCEVCKSAPAIGSVRFPGDDHRTRVCIDCRADLYEAGGPLHTNRPDR